VVCGKLNGSGIDPVGEASVDVPAWLRALGLEQYEAALRVNEIDERVLPSLIRPRISERLAWCRSAIVGDCSTLSLNGISHQKTKGGYYA
jgi:hypothetical protein